MSAQGDGTGRTWSVEIRGDRQMLVETLLLDDLVSALEGETITLQQAEGIAREYRERCVSKGYFLASITVSSESDPETGTLVLQVDQGRMGEKSIYFTGKEGGERRSEGRYFSRDWILRKLAVLREGDAFNYGLFRKAVYEINSHPDVTMDVDLNVRRQDSGRVADLDCLVRETLPLHSLFEVNNTGTEATEQWRFSSTFQYLNPFKRDDTLTLYLGTAIDASLLSGMMSYNIPYEWGNGGSFTVYGGYSDVDIDEIATDTGIQGTGWFGGMRGSWAPFDWKRHAFYVDLDVLYRSVENDLVFSSQTINVGEAKVTPLTLSLNYSSKELDGWGGRNLAMVGTTMNLGGSSDEEMDMLRDGATEDYMIHRFRFSRIQLLSGRASRDKPSNEQWILLFKVQGQWADSELIPSEQLTIGGTYTVRGYKEYAIKGDSGYYGTLEIRTPHFTDVFSSRWGSGGENSDGEFTDSWQFILFADGGRVESDNPQPGDLDSQTIYSLGLGLRAAITKYVNLRFDYGFPLEDLEDDDNGDGFHAALKVQF